MKTLEDFKLSLCAYGMETKKNENVDVVFLKYQELTSRGGEEALVALWKNLHIVPEKREWPELEYKPNLILKPRVREGSLKVIDDFNGNYPKNLDFEGGADFDHLVLHGKMGLMIFLQVLSERDEKARVKDIAVIIDKFMTHMEELMEEALFSRDIGTLAQAFGVQSCKPEQSFEDWIRARFQPFSIMRSLYLEPPNSELSPQQWWQQQERYLPNLPNC
jgi:hypothetical protein